jgi:hypothetical protein
MWKQTAYLPMRFKSGLVKKEERNTVLVEVKGNNGKVSFFYYKNNLRSSLTYSYQPIEKDHKESEIVDSVIFSLALAWYIPSRSSSKLHEVTR